MNSVTIPFSQAGKMSSIMKDYLYDVNQLDHMIYAPPTMDGFQKKIADYQFSWEKRELLVHRLTSQYETAGIEVPENVKKLYDQNAFTITTGHQLCLFGGPQYFIHKIVSVIDLSKRLKKEFPEKNFIPVFWMASEDHDFDEINQVNLFGKQLKTSESPTGPVGRVNPQVFKTTLEELKQILGDAEGATKLWNMFNDAYNEESLSLSFRKWVNEFFKDHGLVIIDGDDDELKRSFASLVKDELLEQHTKVSVDVSSSILKSKGYHVQVTPREINLFYIEDGLRERIVLDNGVYRVLNSNITFTEESLLECLENHPERFSPNAILRPLYEEFILPNLAYVGGPGELAYWFQLKANFDRFSVPFPLLVLRDSFLMGQQKQLDTLEKMNISIPQVFGDLDALLKQYVVENSGDELNFESENEALSKLKEELLRKVTAIDPSLKGMVLGEMKGVEKTIEKLEKKLIKGKKQKEEVQLNRIRKIREQWFPQGVLQERSQSFIPNYLKLQDDYLPVLLENANVFLPELKLIAL